MQGKIAIVVMILVLAAINWSIMSKEKHLAEGTVVYLDLAPIDPRSLMQGDFMALRFRIADEIYRDLPKSAEYKRWRHNVEGTDGLVVVELGDKGIATYKRLQSENEVLADNELLLKFRVRNGAVKFATNAFFFQEGLGEIYQPARYGQFRVDDHGELLLVAMYDGELNILQPGDNSDAGG